VFARWQHHSRLRSVIASCLSCSRCQTVCDLTATLFLSCELSNWRLRLNKWQYRNKYVVVLQFFFNYDRARFELAYIPSSNITLVPLDQRVSWQPQTYKSYLTRSYIGLAIGKYIDNSQVGKRNQRSDINPLFGIMKSSFLKSS